MRVAKYEELLATLLHGGKEGRCQLYQSQKINLELQLACQGQGWELGFVASGAGFGLSHPNTFFSFLVPCWPFELPDTSQGLKDQGLKVNNVAFFFSLSLSE